MKFNQVWPLRGKFFMVICGKSGNAPPLEKILPTPMLIR